MPNRVKTPITSVLALELLPIPQQTNNNKRLDKGTMNSCELIMKKRDGGKVKSETEMCGKSSAINQYSINHFNMVKSD